MASQTISQSITVVQLATKPVDRRRMHGRFRCTAFQPYWKAILSSETTRWLTTNAELQRPGTLFFIQQRHVSSARPELTAQLSSNRHDSTTYYSNSSRSPSLASTSVAFGIMDESSCTHRGYDGRVISRKIKHCIGHVRPLQEISFCSSVALVQLLAKLLRQHVHLAVLIRPV